MREPTESTVYRSRLQIIDALAKGKRILVETKRLTSAVQTAIDLMMEEVEKRVNVHLQKCDNWKKKKTFGKYDQIKSMETLKKLIILENNIMELVERILSPMP